MFNANENRQKIVHISQLMCDSNVEYAKKIIECVICRLVIECTAFSIAMIRFSD